ncbi:hypothetical protein ACP70R_041843 [Stipagrostis hirtigluma subsp. patula]
MRRSAVARNQAALLAVIRPHPSLSQHYLMGERRRPIAHLFAATFIGRDGRFGRRYLLDFAGDRAPESTQSSVPSILALAPSLASTSTTFCSCRHRLRIDPSYHLTVAVVDEVKEVHRTPTMQRG